MSSPLARLLLRVYPREFRETCGPDALRLIEDRWRDERCAGQRLRLCFDLIVDLVATRWRSQCRVRQVQSTGGGPTVLFHAFERDAAAGTILPGMVLSVLLVIVVARVITPEGDRDLAVLLQIFANALSGL